MSNFSARTRLRGEVSYYKANWIDEGPKYKVTFLEGPHKGNTYPDEICVGAKDE